MHRNFVDRQDFLPKQTAPKMRKDHNKSLFHYLEQLSHEQIDLNKHYNVCINLLQ